MSTDVYLDFWAVDSKDVDSGPFIRIGHLGNMQYPSYELFTALQFLSVAFPIIEPGLPAAMERLAIDYQARMAPKKQDGWLMGTRHGWELDSPSPEKLKIIFTDHLGMRWGVRVD